MKLHLLLSPTIDYVSEDETGALSRYKGFAAEFFVELYASLPQLRGHFLFFRDIGTDDLWSICEGVPASFGIQLDPDCEVICIWNANAAEEIGFWPPQIANPVDYAIQRIREHYLSNA